MDRIFNADSTAFYSHSLEATMSEIEVPLEDVHEHIQHNAHESKERWVSLVALSTAWR